MAKEPFVVSITWWICQYSYPPHRSKERPGGRDSEPDTGHRQSARWWSPTHKAKAEVRAQCNHAQDHSCHVGGAHRGIRLKKIFAESDPTQIQLPFVLILPSAPLRLTAASSWSALANMAPDDPESDAEPVPAVVEPWNLETDERL